MLSSVVYFHYPVAESFSGFKASYDLHCPASSHCAAMSAIESFAACPEWDNRRNNQP
jgi:hypothetical protein